MTKERTLIVTAGFQPLAAQLCASLSSAGAGMLTTPLSPTGIAPATHYISAGPIGDDFAAILPCTSVDAEGTVTTRPGNVAVVEALAAQAGITLPPGTIAALFAAIDVSEQGPWEAMARLGVTVAQEAL